MSRARGALGAEGERRAAGLLARRGYRIAGRNVRAGGVEVDLVALRGSLAVFVEVKTRRDLGHGAPEEAVDPRKQRRIARAASAWLRAHPEGIHRARFDVIACRVDAAGRWSLRHWEGAFDAPEW